MIKVNRYKIAQIIIMFACSLHFIEIVILTDCISIPNKIFLGSIYLYILVTTGYDYLTK